MEFKDLIGKTLTKCYQVDSDKLVFVVSDDEAYVLYHEQDCCESVDIEDIAGDLNDLVGHPILQAIESVSEGNGKSEWTESCTWTFYNIATVKGYVTVRYYGESNGYYSESVSFTKFVNGSPMSWWDHN